MSEEDEGLFDDVPLANRERDRAFEAFIKRKDVKAMFSDGFPFPLNRGYYDFWCIVWAKAWDKGFKIGWEERGKHDKRSWERDDGLTMTRRVYRHGKLVALIAIETIQDTPQMRPFKHGACFGDVTHRPTNNQENV